MELQSSSLLAPLSAAELGALMAFLRPVSFVDGATLFHQGELPDGCFLIEEGEVALSNQLPGGKVTPAERVCAGGLVGEAALVGAAPRTQTATAVGAVRALFIEGKNLPVLRALISPIHARFLCHLATSLARRFRALTQFPLVDGGAGPAEDPARAPLGRHEQPGFRADLTSFFPMLPFFREFARSEVEALLAVSQIWELPRGRWLFAAGDTADTSFITLRGACEIRWRGQPPGRRLVVWGPGRLIDAVELMLAGTRPIDCRVRESATVLALPHAAWRELLEQRSPVALKMLCATTLELLERLSRATRLLASRDLVFQLGL